VILHKTAQNWSML